MLLVLQHRSVQFEQCEYKITGCTQQTCEIQLIPDQVSSISLHESQ